MNEIEFAGEIWYWRGPAPWYFVTVPEEECGYFEAEAGRVSYGWGMIPVTAEIGGSEWATSMFPKDGRYVLPVKASVRRAEDLDDGDVATVRLRLRSWTVGGRG
ncbi:DUF1905 domain-containing protein [Kribbella sp. GL6]|uniref:DUF1905 domain-containing protein n=1 Tax=Kribbella sp. GL6 TaxID=3419765 RepID=UPI003D07F718